MPLLSTPCYLWDENGNRLRAACRVERLRCVREEEQTVHVCQSVTSCSSRLFLLGQAAFLGLSAAIKTSEAVCKTCQRSHGNDQPQLLRRCWLEPPQNFLEFLKFQRIISRCIKYSYNKKTLFTIPILSHKAFMKQGDATNYCRAGKEISRQIWQ